MAYRLRHSDDFSGYASTTDVQNAYLWWDGSAPTVAANGGAWSANGGPGGGPGVVDLAGGAGTLQKNIDLFCRSGAMELTADYVDWTGPGSALVMQVWWGYPYSPSMSEFSSMFFSVSHSVAGTAQLTVNRTGSNYSSGFVGSIPAGPVLWRVEWTLPTITGTPGSFTPGTDGSVALYANGVLVASTTGELWHDDNSIPSPNPGGSYSPYLNIVEMNVHGRVGLWQVWDSDDCIAFDPPVDDSNICGCSSPGGDVSDGGGTGNGADPVLTPVIGNNGIPIGCVGGGLVPTQANLAFSETWLGL
jgi:hypothetical protein